MESISNTLPEPVPYSLAAYSLATISLYYGLNAMIRPENALSWFQFPYPQDKYARRLLDHMIVVYGVRNVFVAFSIYTATYLKQIEVAGWLLVFVSGLAVTDGFVNKSMIGKGQWAHWGYVPVVGGVGLLLTGVLSQKA